MKNISGKTPASFVKINPKVTYTIPTEEEYFNDWVNKNGGIYYMDRRKGGGYSCKLWKNPYIIDYIALDKYRSQFHFEKYRVAEVTKKYDNKMKKLWKEILLYKATQNQLFFDKYCGKGRVEVSARTDDMRIKLPDSPSKFKMILNDKVI